MGNKKGNSSRLTGLSRFLQAFDAGPSNTIPSTPPVVVDEQLVLPHDAELEDSAATKGERVHEPHHDAVKLVPHYKDASEVPEHLQKYFSQRTRLFSLYDEGCLLDEEGWYSVTPEAVADQIAERCRCGTVLDAFCGVGGNTIAFAKTCERVIAIDTSPTRLALARHNAEIYGVADRIEFILGDFLSFARSFPSTSLSKPSSPADTSTRKIDVVFLSPPWGGPSYLSGSTTELNLNAQDDIADATAVAEMHPEFGLDGVAPVHGRELFAIARRITPNIAYYLPRNTKLEEVATLVSGGHGQGKRKRGEEAGSGEKVEVEE
ncbi:RNA cap guanine-N2 methyltransferase-domain-containing protein, partial [Amylostereum chailletii]